MQEPQPVATARANLAAAEAKHGADSAEVAEAAIALGNRLVEANQFEAGGAQFERALAIRLTVFGEGHIRTRIALNNIANARIAGADPAGAMVFLQRSAAAAQRAGAQDVAEVGAQLGLGAAQRALGQYQEARTAFANAVRVADLASPTNPLRALARQGLATACMTFGEFERARALIEEALAIAELDPQSQPCAHAVFGMGMALGHAGRFDEAIPVLQRGLGMVQRAFQPESLKSVLSAAVLAEFLLQAGQLDAAAAAAHTALQTAKDRTGLFARARAQAHGVLAAVAAAAGRVDEALAAARAMTALRDPAAMTLTDQARQETVLVRALAAAGQRDEAIAAFRRAIALFEQDASANGIGDGVGQVEVRSALAHELAARGEAAAAVVEWQHALAAFRGNVDRMLPAMLEGERLRAVQRHRSNLDALLAATRDGQALSAAQQHAEVLVW